MGIIAAIIEQLGYDVMILDCFGNEYTKEESIKQIEAHDPSVILIGSVTANFSIAMDILKEAKAKNPLVITIIGGPHVSVNPESAFEQPAIVDYAVIGEAEETIKELIPLIKGKPSIKREEIKGLMYVADGQKVRTTPRDVVKELDTLPLPAYHLFPMEKYHSYGWLDLGKKFTTMTTSRGCPFKCSFCQSSHQAKYWRQRSAENVFREIRLLYDQYHIGHIYFTDDEFCVNHKRVIQLCDMIKAAQLDIVWECLTRVNHMDDDLLAAMASAGCKSIVFGLEVGYEEGFKRINKPITKEMVITAVRMAQKHGIIVKASFVMGFPWEGVEELKQTIAFAKKVNAEITFFNMLTPYPGTPVYEEVMQNNLFEQPADYDGHLMQGTESLVRTAKLSTKQLQYWTGRAVLEYYLRPSYLLKRIRQVNNWQEFKRNFVGGNGLLRTALKKVVLGTP